LNPDTAEVYAVGVLSFDRAIKNDADDVKIQRDRKERENFKTFVGIFNLRDKCI